SRASLAGLTPKPGPCGIAIFPSIGSGKGLSKKFLNGFSKYINSYTANPLKEAANCKVAAMHNGPEAPVCGATATPKDWASAAIRRTPVNPPARVILG